MKKSFQIGAAFIGVIVGAGFASGQEVLQFFTSFGAWGILGSVIAAGLFAFLGMNLTQLGSRLQTKSHESVVYHICGKYFGTAVDFIITFFLFGVTVVMFSGSGAIFEQQFGIPSLVGNILMAVLVIGTVLLNVNKVISLISLFTPILLLAVIALTVYSLAVFDFSTADFGAAAGSQAAPHWLIGACLYVSYNLAAGAAMMTVMGGTVKDEKVAGWGGLIGGLGLGLLILLINVTMLTQLKAIAAVPMPTLFLANNISPVMGVLMSVILLGMIYNTAVGMLYAFTARLVKPGTQKFKASVGIFGVVAFASSFVGFVTLVGTVYPVMGYLGFVLIAAIVIAWFRTKKAAKQKKAAKVLSY
ncbi:YkvI family membrane protein [Planococcus plakortidis]|uniref:YkvI family membrane protein n=1 Tax=Planococcus plakortidis TaxID=1038856 RepID=UPI0039846244